MFYLIHSDTASPERIGSVELQKRIKSGAINATSRISTETKPDDVHPASHFFPPQFSQRTEIIVPPTPSNYRRAFLHLLIAVIVSLPVGALVLWHVPIFTSIEQTSSGNPFVPQFGTYAAHYTLKFQLLGGSRAGSKVVGDDMYVAYIPEATVTGAWPEPDKWWAFLIDIAIAGSICAGAALLFTRNGCEALNAPFRRLLIVSIAIPVALFIALPIVRQNATGFLREWIDIVVKVQSVGILITFFVLNAFRYGRNRA